MADFNTISFPLNYAVFAKNTIDTKYYGVSVPTDPLGAAVPTLATLTGGKRIRLLEFGFEPRYIFYSPVPAGEYGFRKIIDFSMLVPSLSLEGTNLLDPLTGQILQYNFTEDQKLENLGKGLIIDDFVIPTTIINLLISENPPSTNLPFFVWIDVILKYNQNGTVNGIV